MTKIAPVPAGSSLLAQVRRLWRAHSDTLGFLPAGAFDEHAAGGSLLAAAEDGAVLGYLLFRITRGRRGSIVHLCVAPAARGRGIARALFQAARVEMAACDDIIVRCRRDFEASALWPRLHFIPVREVAGRGRDPKPLTVWRHEVNPLPLLVAMAESDASIMRVAIDANIFFDLDDPAESTEESRALQADWLGEFVELCVTEEIYNEIDRCEDPGERTRRREGVGAFRCLPRQAAREEQVLTDVKTLLGTGDSESAHSDARHIAKTIAADVTCFVTRDENLRDRADAIYDRHGLAIVAPHELVLHFDALRREEEYRPRRLFFGAATTAARPRADDLEAIADLAHAGHAPPEPKRQTIGRLRGMLSDPEMFDGTCVRTGADLLAAYVIERPSPGVLAVPFFAVTALPLGTTAARHFVDHFVVAAVKEGREVVKVAAAGTRLGDVMRDAGFSREGDVWVKLAVGVAGDAAVIADRVAGVAGRDESARALAERVTSYLREQVARPGLARTSTDTLAAIERVLWPAKIRDAGLPCFIVPIQARWAKELFDLELAGATLFGADPALALRAENAYYRAAKPAMLTAPARILWYVSQDDAYPGTMAIRACSYLDEVVVAPPKEAFHRFRRLGVYSWRDVFGLAGNDLTREVMAFRFSKTETFVAPVTFDAAQPVLRRNGGKGSQFQSPLRISEACFMELYQSGTRGARDVA